MELVVPFAAIRRWPGRRSEAGTRAGRRHDGPGLAAAVAGLTTSARPCQAAQRGRWPLRSFFDMTCAFVTSENLWGAPAVGIRAEFPLAGPKTTLMRRRARLIRSVTVDDSRAG